MTRPIRALIDTYALEKNLSLLRAKSGNRFLWGVVKANAYGHGLIGLLPTFDNWVDGLALLDPKEGVDIRKAGWAKAVLLKQLMRQTVYRDGIKSRIRKYDLVFAACSRIAIVSGLQIGL